MEKILKIHSNIESVLKNQQDLHDLKNQGFQFLSAIKQTSEFYSTKMAVRCGGTSTVREVDSVVKKICEEVSRTNDGLSRGQALFFDID